MSVASNVAQDCVYWAFISMSAEYSIRWHRNMFITHSECVLSIYSEISHAHLEMLFFKLIPPHNVSITSKQLTYCLFARKKKGSLNCYYMYIRTWNYAACVPIEIVTHQIGNCENKQFEIDIFSWRIAAVCAVCSARRWHACPEDVTFNCVVYTNTSGTNAWNNGAGLCCL